MISQTPDQEIPEQSNDQLSDQKLSEDTNESLDIEKRPPLKEVPPSKESEEPDELIPGTFCRWVSKNSSPDQSVESLPARASETTPAPENQELPAPPNTAKNQENPPKEEKSMTLLEHLGELRFRLMRIFIAVLLCFFVTYGFAAEVFRHLANPLLRVMPPDAKFIYTGVAEGFFVDLKVGIVAAIFLASPYLFYQIWAFIAPGLYDEEKRYVLPLSFISAVFFLGGACFCYFIVFPFAFTFFLSYSTQDIVAMLSISEYLSFALTLLLAFGLIFEMPLFSFFLSRMGILTAQRMRSSRKYAVLGVFVVAAILTPPDVFSQMLMAIPMLLLYEISILVAAIVGKKPEKKETQSNESQQCSE